MNNLIQFLNKLPAIDWKRDDIYLHTKSILDRVSENAVELRELIEWSAENHELFSQFECHAQFDRFVIFDALKTKNFRLRIHMWHDNHFDLPHQHRYPFTTKILKGGYHHIVYTTSQRLLSTNVSSNDARPYQNKLSEESIDVAEVVEVEKQFECFHGTGDVYSLRPDILIPLKNTKGNISLFIRGPAIRDNALELELDTGRIFRRHSRMDESVAHRNDIQMSRKKYMEYISLLSNQKII